MAVLSALWYWALVSRAVDIVPLVLSAVGGIGVLFFGFLLFSFMATPATLALEKHMEQEGEGERWWSVSVSASAPPHPREL
jgi:predicted membrane metal-binding protein